MANINIVTAPAERRQIARVMEFNGQHAPYIRWDKVASDAREMGAHFEARYAQDGACTIVMFWAYADGEE